MTAATIKQPCGGQRPLWSRLRSLLGHSNAAWIHAARLAWLGVRKPELEIGLVPAFLREGEVGVDVGANGADWTSVMARRAGGNGRVFAFEADPYYAEVTAKTIRLLGIKNVNMFPFGLSDKQGVAWLQIFDDSNNRVWGAGRIVSNPDSGDVRREQCVQVRLEALDDLARSHPDLRRTRLLKCDVEGFELMVLRGSLRIIEEARPVVVTELKWARSHGYEEKEVFDFFEALDYRCYVAVSDSLLRHSRKSGAIAEGPRDNRVMIPGEYLLPPTIQVETSHSGCREEISRDRMEAS